MPTYLQADRWLTASTPLGSDELKLVGFHGRECVSRLFRFELEFLSEDPAIDFQKIVGEPVSVTIELVDGGHRYFHGHVSRFVQSGRDEHFTIYRAELRPWCWFLTRTADCRIFQEKSVPDILELIFKDLGFDKYQLRLHGSYEPRTYCVQYRETDFAFVSRLMEEEGIFYFFEHTEDKHVLVITDVMAEVQGVPGQERVRLHSGPVAFQDEDVITGCRVEEGFKTGAFAHTDYNFETPDISLMAKVGEDNKFEVYDYPGEYPDRGEGRRLARLRHQELRAQRVTLHGHGTCRAFTSGYRFKLIDHYRDDLNQEWLLLDVHHHARLPLNYRAGDGESAATYDNSFVAVPASEPFRPERSTLRPTVKGCQTAVVVGPPGEEIFTDKYGRIKVQFHWDREGKRNERSSCWVRVATPGPVAAGAWCISRASARKWVVDFLEGDPDQPLVINSVYNAEQMPPFGLPEGAVISGVKSNSTKGGGGYNQISLDDTKGNELIHIHAQYDQDNKVLHDERTSVGHDRTEDVGHDETIHIGHDRKETVDNNETIKIGVDRTENVGNNETITIGNNRTESVGVNETISIGSNRTETVGSNETISIGANRTETVGANETVTVALMRTHTVGINDALTVGAANEITVGGLQSITVGAKRSITVGASQDVTIGAKHDITVASNQTVNVGADLKTVVASEENRSVGKSRTTSIGTDDTLGVGSKLHIKAGSEIVLETGSSKITMKASGAIEISGLDITIKGTKSIKAEALQINIEASGINTITGSLVKIN